MDIRKEYNDFILNNGNLMYLDTSEIKNFNRYQKFFSNVNIKYYDLSNADNISYLFYNRDLRKMNLSLLNTSNVTKAEGTFMKSKFTCSIDDWNVSKLKNAKSMFEESAFNCSLSKWDVKNIIDASSMFSKSDNEKLNLNEWDFGNCEDISGIFSESVCNIKYLDLNRCITFNGAFESCLIYSFSMYLDTSNVKTMYYTFSGSFSENDLNIKFWDMSNCKNTRFMFSNFMCIGNNFDTDDIEPSNNLMLNYWDMSSVKYMDSMFIETGNINLFISDWNIFETENINYMFMDSLANISSLETWHYKEKHTNFLCGSKYISRSGFSYSKSFADHYKLKFLSN